MDRRTVITIALKELRDASRSRWLVLYASIFALLSLAVASVGLSGAGNYGLAGFGRTAAGLINLILLIAPLMGLTLGAMSIAGDRERGTLLYLLAQPVTQAEVLVGKYLGTALALLGALALGFGLSGLVIGWQAGTPRLVDYLVLAALSYLLALASLSIGFLLSALVGRGGTAISTAIFLWLGLAFLSDLGLMTMAIAVRIDPQGLFALVIINPLQTFKIASVLAIRGSLEVLGPSGVYAVRTFGEGGLVTILVGVLALWIVLPLGAGYVAFRRRGAL